jgi:hypothetical protein
MLLTVLAVIVSNLLEGLFLPRADIIFLKSSAAVDYAA